jgi:HD-GYP domain-containing protein (c-di-GMP phosphodiesterase class II)
VPLELLQPGMIVARSVYTGDGLLLINSGKELKPAYIAHLSNLGISSIYVEDLLLTDVEVEDVIPEKVRVSAVKVLKQQLSGLSRTGDAAYPVLDQEKIKRSVAEIVQSLLVNKGVVVNLTDIRLVDDYTFCHSVNVCVLSLLTAITLKYSKLDLELLGVGALLHDAGKVRVPSVILNKPTTLTMEEFAEIKQHSLYGYEILKAQRDISHLSALVAYQHHEKYNGSGYPNGLTIEGIHEFSKIVGMVDVYDALTADRVYRKAYQPHEAFEMLAGAGNYLYDFELVQAFLSNVALYPVGTLVKLNNGHAGVVINTPKGMTNRPTVRIMFGSQMQPLAQVYEVVLAEEPRILIEKVYNLEETIAFTKQFRCSQNSAV